MKNIMRLLFGLTCSVALVLAGCGGGSDTGAVDYNKLLSGNFQIHQAGDQTAAGPIQVDRVDISADGAGAVTTLGGTVTYTVASDRTVSVDTGGATVSGILSADGGFVVMSDADRTVSAVAPLSDEAIVLAAGLKKTAGLDVTKLSGDYQIHQFGTGGTGGYTAKAARVIVASNANGTGTWGILADSEGGAGVNGTFTYTVSATDGTFSVTTSVGATEIGTDHGVISADGSLFLLTDIDPVAVVGPPAEDAEIVLAVGVKKSTTVRSDADLKGRYQINQVGDAGTGRSTARVNLTADGIGGGTYTVVASSAGGAGGSGAFTYVVNADGTLTVDLGAGVAKQGILSADGSMFVLSDTEKLLDPEIVLAVGIKK